MKGEEDLGKVKRLQFPYCYCLVFIVSIFVISTVKGAKTQYGYYEPIDNLSRIFNYFAEMLLGTDRDHFSFQQHMSDMAPGFKSHQLHNCSMVAYLSERQKHMCQKSEKVLDTISSGAKLGIEECQHQLQSHRWNCSVVREATNVFGKLLDIQTREKAYVHAISSASLAYQVTKACARGELQDCSCDETVRARSTKGKWQCGGCSDDVKYGALFSKEFADSIEDGSSETGLMNLHNNEAGRRIFTCDWWGNVDCETTKEFYQLNEQIGQLEETNAGTLQYAQFEGIRVPPPPGHKRNAPKIVPKSQRQPLPDKYRTKHSYDREGKEVPANGGGGGTSGFISEDDEDVVKQFVEEDGGRFSEFSAGKDKGKTDNVEGDRDGSSQTIQEVHAKPPKSKKGRGKGKFQKPTTTTTTPAPDDEESEEDGNTEEEGDEEDDEGEEPAATDDNKQGLIVNRRPGDEEVPADGLQPPNFSGDPVDSDKGKSSKEQGATYVPPKPDDTYLPPTTEAPQGYGYSKPGPLYLPPNTTTPDNTYLPPKQDPTPAYLPPTTGGYSPAYLPPTASSQYLPPNSTYLPPQQQNQYLPPNSNQYLPPNSNQYLPPKSNQYLPPQSNQYLPPDNQYLPPKSNQYLPSSFQQDYLPASVVNQALKHLASLLANQALQSYGPYGQGAPPLTQVHPSRHLYLPPPPTDHDHAYTYPPEYLPPKRTSYLPPTKPSYYSTIPNQTPPTREKPSLVEFLSVPLVASSHSKGPTY